MESLFGKRGELKRILEALLYVMKRKALLTIRDSDVLIVIRHLYYYAGWAELLDEQVTIQFQIGFYALIPKVE